MRAVAIVFGATLVFLAGREIFIAFQTSSFRVRWSRRRMRRKTHPVMYWLNMVALVIACCAGLAIAGISFSI
jgi:hypothetical protein